MQADGPRTDTCEQKELLMLRRRPISMTLTALGLAVAGVLLAACGGASAAASPVDPAAARTVATGPVAASASAATPLDAELSPEEIEGLYWMRQEEKLARDVYLAMFDRWGETTFERIAASEARHLEAVLGLIEAYGLEDPVVDDAPGVFADPELGALYLELVERGSESLVAAFTVGATIEDLDILDLEEELALTGQPDIRRVYENLLRGSVNHLRAFTGRLESEGAEYEAVYHSEEELAALLADGERRGRDRRGR